MSLLLMLILLTATDLGSGQGGWFEFRSVLKSIFLTMICEKSQNLSLRLRTNAR